MSFDRAPKLEAIPAASTATRVTSASPIISAAAVERCAAGSAARCRARALPATPPIVRGPAEHAGERPDHAHGQERDAEEDAERADTHAEQHLRRPEVAARRARRGARRSRAASTARSRRPEACEARLAAASRPRARRRSAARASRGSPAAGSRAASRGSRRASETTTVRVSKTRPLFGSVKPTASKSEKSPFASASPRKSPTIEASDADDERLEDDRAQHLAPRRAERAQRRELARPLRDRDRERVRDHEARRRRARSRRTRAGSSAGSE